MKNYWLDKRYPLATAIREWRKRENLEDECFINESFIDIASDILLKEKGNAEDWIVDKLVKAAWDRVDKFDLQQKDKAIQYFTNAMKWHLQHMAPLMAVAHTNSESIARKRAWETWKETHKSGG